ncbi:MAG: selenium-dependent molybdenum cofactor biosynthesis protein YqeB [Clostridia bacterium]|nr:selenium-dependent molybdenum cofactor biosynthesis protein YqeB [Clostridia bacterium]
MLVAIKGAGDLASGVAVRLKLSGFEILMTEIEHPTAIRRTVCFSRAVNDGAAVVEGLKAKSADSPGHALELIREGYIAVLVDPRAKSFAAIKPDAVVDAILAKRNTGTSITDAPMVIALGPGFTAGRDCHAVVETMRGHDLGRVILSGSAAANTGIPGNIGGYSIERLLRAPCDGIWQTDLDIGVHVDAGQTVATVGGMEVKSEISGVIRGLLPSGTPVTGGMKSGDVDPRGVADYCLSVSDKARAIAGGVLEAILRLGGGLSAFSQSSRNA